MADPFLQISAGVNFTDPYRFKRFLVASSSIFYWDSANSNNGLNVAGGFTVAAINGLADDTNWTADTYKTILSDTGGRGIVSHLIGPTGLAGTPITTFEITVDGMPKVEIAVTATTTGQRAILGPLANADILAGTNAPFRSPSATAAAKSTMVTGVNGIPSWITIGLLGTPCLVYRSSILIRMKTSENNSTTTNQERQSAVSYRRDV